MIAPAGRVHVGYAAQVENGQGRGLLAQFGLKGEEGAKGYGALKGKNSSVRRLALAGVNCQGFLLHLGCKSKQNYTRIDE